MSSQNQTNHTTCLYSLLPPSTTITSGELSLLDRIHHERQAFDRATVYTMSSVDAVISFYTRVINCLGIDIAQNQLGSLVEAFRMKNIGATHMILHAATILTEYDNLLRCLVVILPQGYKIEIDDKQGYKTVRISGPMDIKLTIYGPLSTPSTSPGTQMPTPPESSGYAPSPTPAHVLSRSPMKAQQHYSKVATPDNHVSPPNIQQQNNKAAIPDTSVPVDRTNSYYGHRVQRSGITYGDRVEENRSVYRNVSAINDDSAKIKISLPPLEHIIQSTRTLPTPSRTPIQPLPRILPAPLPPRNILPATSSSHVHISPSTYHLPEYPLSVSQPADQSSSALAPKSNPSHTYIPQRKEPFRDAIFIPNDSDVPSTRQRAAYDNEQHRIPCPPDKPNGEFSSTAPTSETSALSQSDAPSQADTSQASNYHSPVALSTTAQQPDMLENSPMPEWFTPISTMSQDDVLFCPRENPIVKQNDVAMFAQIQEHLPSETYQDFLKLLNMFTQEILDVGSLVMMLEPLFQDRQDILAWLKALVGYVDEPRMLTIPDPPLKKPDLSLCVRVKNSPSYRRVANQAWINQPCSARDDLCREVLNDIYVSYPTEESEDSKADTFKSNKYEEALHRVEEKRYEFDSYIDDNEKAISMLLHIQREEGLDKLTDEQKKNYNKRADIKKPIITKAIKAAYGKKFAPKALNAFYKNPAQNIPIVLSFLESEGAKWRKARRELQEIWGKQERKNYFLSLEYKPKPKKNT